MKGIVVAVMLILLNMRSLGQPKKVQDIMGHWEVAGKQNSGCGLEIIDSTSLVLIYMSERKIVHDFRIDYTKSPMWLDFSVKDSGAVINVKSLLEIINDSMIKWQLFIDEDRVDHFSSNKGELYYLKKSTPNLDPVFTRN